MWPLLIVCSFTLCLAKPPSPHILFIIADDLGINDVGYNNPDIISPNIDFLARTGIILNQSYVQPLCTPSRAAFMTGIYPFKLGVQHMVISPLQNVCVPLNKTFLPQVLKDNGYATHLIGKWHLGSCKLECTPTYRGFDSFYGFYAGAIDYYNKTFRGGYDFWLNTEVDRSAAGEYNAEQFTKRFEDILEDHDPDVPLFSYLSYENVHQPLQVPDYYLSLYPNTTDVNRKYTSAMVTNLDDNIGRAVKALKDKGMYDDTIIVFTSDNGGWTTYGANNYPLRGGKITIFEGGTRVAAFVHGPMLKNKGVVYDGMMHAVDWFPTFLGMAGIDYYGRLCLKLLESIIWWVVLGIAGIDFFDPEQDGLDLWTSINKLKRSKRKEFVYNMDFHPEPLQGRAAIRVGDYKLIQGFPGPYDGWYLPGAADQGPPLTIEVISANYHDVLSKVMMDELLGVKSVSYLFNLKDDPEERHNLYEDLPCVAGRLEKRLDSYKKYYVAPNFPPNDPRGLYINFDGVWSHGWC